MTPTLDWVYGADTKDVVTRQFGGSGTGLWDNATNTASFTFIAGRVSGTALHCIEGGGVNSFLSRNVVPSQSRVVSFWFRVPTAPVFDGSGFFQVFDATSTAMVRFVVNAAGNIRGQAGNGTNVTGPAVSDNAWHLLNFWIDTSGTTWTLHWSVDGSAQTNATHAGHVATDSSFLNIGNVTTTHNLTFDLDDLITGVTSAEYPLATVANNHQVIASLPDADGTHNNTPNALQSQAGTAVQATTVWSLLDEFPATTTDYVRQNLIGAGNYAEVNFADATGTPAIWAVQGTMAGFSQSGTAPNDGTAVILDASSNTLTTIYSGDMVATSTNFKQAIITPPAGGWAADYDGVKARIGFSSDVTPNPRWTALMLEYVTAVNVVTATAAVTGAGTVNVSSTLRSRFATANVTGVGSLTTNLVITSSIITGSKWNTTDQEWDSVSDEWDGTLVISAVLGGAGTISATAVRTALTISATVAVTGAGSFGATAGLVWDGEADVLGEGLIELDATETTAGIAQVTGTGTISASALHIATPSVNITGQGIIIASIGATHIRPVQKFASYDHVISLTASFDDTLRKGASRLGVKSPITKANNWFVGEDQTFEYTSITGGAVDNIAGWTLSFKLAPAAGETSVLTIAGSITDASNGVFEVVSAAAGTASLDPGVYYYDVSRTDSGHNQVLAFGPANLQARVA